MFRDVLPRMVARETAFRAWLNVATVVFVATAAAILRLVDAAPWWGYLLVIVAGALFGFGARLLRAQLRRDSSPAERR
jgi:hypothetical protein